jgi:hypothetical protein
MLSWIVQHAAGLASNLRQADESKSQFKVNDTVMRSRPFLLCGSGFNFLKLSSVSLGWPGSGYEIHFIVERISHIIFEFVVPGIGNI